MCFACNSNFGGCLHSDPQSFNISRQQKKKGGIAAALPFPFSVFQLSP